MHTRLMLLLFVLVLAGTLTAQTKFSGELKCELLNPAYSLPAADREDHIFRIAKSKCMWTRTFEIDGVKAVSEDTTGFVELMGEKARARGFNVGLMSNGDKYHVNWQWTGIIKEGVVQNADVTWTWTGVSGKLKGLRAKGQSKGKGAPDGTSIWVAEGEYQFKR
jgi:hypothetical protein